VARERFDGVVMDQIWIGAEGVCEVLNLPLAVPCNRVAGRIDERSKESVGGGTGLVGFDISGPAVQCVRSAEKAVSRAEPA